MPMKLEAVSEDCKMEICPRCHRQRVVFLRSMTRHSDVDWFKCDGCEHIFTRPRPTHNEVPLEDMTATKVAS